MKPFSHLQKIRAMATHQISKIFTKSEKSESKKCLLPVLEEIPEEENESVKIESLESPEMEITPKSDFLGNNSDQTVERDRVDENNNAVSTSENEAFKNTEMIGNTGDQFESIPFSHNEKTTSAKESDNTDAQTQVIFLA